MGEEKRRGKVIGKTKIYGLKFVDDVAASADSPEGLQNMLRDLEKTSSEIGMGVNESKTNVMVFQNGGRRKKEKWEYKRREVEVVKEYKYLPRSLFFDRKFLRGAYQENDKQSKQGYKYGMGIMEKSKIKYVK